MVAGLGALRLLLYRPAAPEAALDSVHVLGGGDGSAL